MAKSMATQCKCGVWFPISQGKLSGSSLICSRCACKANHPAGKAIAHV